MTFNEWTAYVIGKPYQLDVRDGSAFDCYGLVLSFFREVEGIDLPDWRWPGTKTEAARMIELGNRVAFDSIDTPVDGCLVLGHGTTAPHHVGIYHSGKVIHSLKDIGVCSFSVIKFIAMFRKTTYGVVKCRR